MEWTGERVIPDKMKGNEDILKDHIARYEFAKEYCNGKVLDVSCGTGYGYGIIGATLGVDNSVEAIEYARKRYGGNFEICDLDIDFPAGKFDVCVSFETIEHLNNIEVFLKNVVNNCEVFICSIPINSPSKFHNKVYTMESAKEEIENYFNDIEWFYQCRGKDITKEENKKANFLICIAK